jgi:hypothetical protein
VSEALHKQGEWVIQPIGPRQMKWKTLITHMCGKVPGTNYYYMVDIPSKSCPTCKSSIPKDVFEAWKSQNAHMMRYL